MHEMMVLEQDSGFVLALDSVTELFDVFKGEHLERSFEKLEDAQDSFWSDSVAKVWRVEQFPAFDW